MSITLSEINIFPIKSCGGFSVESWHLEPRGFKFDRRWMLVDDEGMFLTQREFPRMALIAVEVKSDYLQVDAPGMERLSLPFESASQQHIPVIIWDDGVEALEVGAEAAEWFSDFLGISTRIVVMTERSIRPVDKKYAVNHEVVSFADAFPFLLISEGSVQELNSRLASPISMKRFRPNLVVKGCEPFAEDKWKEILIGNEKFNVAKPCARCKITTVDPETGEKGVEPLRTLSTYRSVEDKVLFGQNLVHVGTGELRVGDVVSILSTK